MEAVYVNVHSQDVNSIFSVLYSIKFVREQLNILFNDTTNDKMKFFENTNNYFSDSNIRKVSFEVSKIDGKKSYIFEWGDEKREINARDFSYDFNYLPNIDFIDNFGFADMHIIEAYSSIQRKDEEFYLNNLLKKFDTRIDAFKIIDEKPQCKVNGEYLEIIEFGDGIRHLLSIVTSLYKCENGYLFIDEMDNGIHYTMLDELWKIILEVSKKLNVQVFATTHSKECIESYARVAEELEDKEITFFKLGKNQEGELKGMVYPYDWFIDSVEQEQEMRGW
jgi:AAA15 family ATPase/GTPase